MRSRTLPFQLVRPFASIRLPPSLLSTTSRMWSDTLLAVERAHLLRLLGWAGASVIVGTALYATLTLRRVGSALLRHFAIQTFAWGLVNLAIAGTGILRLADRDLASATRLDRLLWLSVGLDIGTIVVGLTLAVAGWTLARRLALVGAGIGVMLQGAGLLVLDLRFLAVMSQVL